MSAQQARASRYRKAPKVIAFRKLGPEGRTGRTFYDITTGRAATMHSLFDKHGFQQTFLCRTYLSNSFPELPMPVDSTARAGR